MNNRRIRLFTVLALMTALAALGCHSGSGDGGPPGAAVRAYFSLDETAGFFDLPFPFDYRRTPQGGLDLSGFPNPWEVALLDRYFGVISGVDGFSLNAALYVRFSGPIDTASLPGTPAESLENSSPVFLINVDPLSPEIGRRHPLDLKYLPDSGTYYDDHLLAALPLYGLGLREETLYAFAVTQGLRDAWGRPVSASPDFRKIIAGEADMTAVQQEVREVLQPLFDYLDEERLAGGELSPGPGDLAAASVFRTRSVVWGLAAVRDFITEDYEMAATGDLEFIPDMEPEQCSLVQGTFVLPEFQEGQSPYWTGGGVVFDESGAPVVQREVGARFALSVPTGPMPEAGWPVVLYAHGTGGSYISFTKKKVHERLGALGISVLSTDEPLNGCRHGSAGPAPYLFYNFLNPTAGIDNHRQSAADKASLLRLARQLDVPAEASPTGGPIRLDCSRAAYMGHSQGGITGALFLGVEPEIGAAVLSGTGGGFSLTLVNQTREFGAVKAVVQELLGLDEGEALDEFHPVTTLLQTYAEPADPICYARTYMEEPLGGVPKNLFLSEGMADANTPPQTTEAFAAALGLPQARPVHNLVDGLTLKGLEPVDLPLQGNLAYEGARSTGALIQYEPGDHWALFAEEEREMQYVNFLASYIETGLARIEP